MYKWILSLLLPYYLMAGGMNFSHSLYLCHIGKTVDAIDSYQNVCKENHTQDFEVLRQLSLMIMKEGADSKDKTAQILSMYGAGLAASSFSMEILEKGISHPDPEIQLVSLFFISKLQDDRSDEILSRVAMSSPYLATRMEACFHMASRKHPHTVGHIESLMGRLPPIFKAFFPSFFALMGTSDAIAVLRKLLHDRHPIVRVQSILSIMQFHRDDLLPLLRKRISYANIAELEACAMALGYLKDTSSIPQLIKLSDSSTDHVRLAALKALYALGDTSVKQQIEIMALSHNVFAIQALGDMFGTEDTLAELLSSKSIQVRVNAAISLLRRRDPRALPVLKEFFLDDSRGIAFQPQHSVGYSHNAIKVIFSSKQREKDPLVDLSISLSLKEHFLKESMNLGEEPFLEIAAQIFAGRQNDLAPLLINLLENLRTENAIQLLKTQAERIGAPFIRDYANLSLFRLKEEGPYEARVINWLKKCDENEEIHLRPHLSLQDRAELSEYSLSAVERSQLLLDTFGALASCQNEKSISIVLDAIKKGSPNNRYALAGLLMRATE